MGREVLRDSITRQVALCDLPSSMTKSETLAEPFTHRFAARPWRQRTLQSAPMRRISPSDRRILLQYRQRDNASAHSPNSPNPRPPSCLSDTTSTDWRGSGRGSSLLVLGLLRLRLVCRLSLGCCGDLDGLIRNIARGDYGSSLLNLPTPMSVLATCYGSVCQRAVDDHSSMAY